MHTRIYAVPYVSRVTNHCVLLTPSARGPSQHVCDHVKRKNQAGVATVAQAYRIVRLQVIVHARIRPTVGNVTVSTTTIRKSTFLKPRAGAQERNRQVGQLSYQLWDW